MTPAPAATVTLVRDSAQGLEVLMMRRNARSVFVGGRYVFPGGSVDPADALPEIYGCCDGIDDAQASHRLGVAAGGLAYWIAAIRESFEEAGLLLARDAAGKPVDTGRAAQLARHRKAVASGELAFEVLLRDEGLRADAGALVYFSHWITPVGAPRRYDTRFFVALAPAGQEPVSDNDETVESAWVRPHEGIARYEEGTFKLMTPTIHTLRRFAAYDSAAALLGAMRAGGSVPTIAPRISRDGRRLLPGEPGYDEAAKYEGEVSWRKP